MNWKWWVVLIIALVFSGLLWWETLPSKKTAGPDIPTPTIPIVTVEPTGIVTQQTTPAVSPSNTPAITHAVIRIRGGEEDN